MKTRTLIKRFAPYFAKYKGILILDLFCAALTTLCELVLPLLVRAITNQAINDPAALTVAFVLRLGGLYLLLRLVDALASYFMINQGHVMGTQIETDMRRDLFSHLQKLSFGYYSHAKVGQLMARMTSDLFDVTEFAHHCPEEFFIALLKIGVSFMILSGMNVWLTVLIFLMLPLMILCIRKYNRHMHRTSLENRRQLGEINS
ncbi:MAG: ABC transporter ATP-binding protein, partial [Clostridia bacterium]|nr:ABC transporter ATP-binding protein [Clostridia bacterium]